MKERAACGREDGFGTLLSRRQVLGIAGVTSASAALAFAGGIRRAGAATTDEPPAPDVAIGQTRTVRILATSDLHGKLMPWNYPADEADASGSMPQLATAIAELRDEHTLLVDVGDTIQDNMAEVFLEDEVHPMIAALNYLDYDVEVTGNHDYNFGMDALRRMVAAFEGTALTGNVIDEFGTPVADGYAIFTVGGVRVGIIGMVTPCILRWDAANLVDCTVTNPIDETRAIIDQIAGDVDVLVAAVHMGIDTDFDMPGTGVCELVEACPELDVVLASHGHRLIEGELIGNALVVENKYQAQTLAVVDLEFERTSQGWKLLGKTARSVDVSACEPDPAMMEFLAPFDKRAMSYAHEVIGRLDGGPLAPPDEIQGVPTPMLQDTALNDLVNRVQLHYSGADVSATELSEMGANIEPGDIRRCDVAKVYKHTNMLYTLRMTGRQLRTFLEWSATSFKQWQPGDVTLAFTDRARTYTFEVMSGVSYRIDVSADEGSRILDLAWPDGTPLSDDDTFVLAASDFRANAYLLVHGEVFSEGEALPELLEPDVRGDIGGVREMIADYIQNVCAGVITPEVDHNWELVGNDWDPALHDRAVELIHKGRITVANENDASRWLSTTVVREEDLEV